MTKIGNKKIFVHCVYFAVGGIIADLISWFGMYVVGLIIYLVLVFPFIAVFLWANISAVVSAADNAELSKTRCRSISLIFSAAMAISSFICRIIIFVGLGGGWPDAEDFLGTAAVIAGPVLILFIVSFVTCVLLFRKLTAKKNRV